MAIPFHVHIPFVEVLGFELLKFDHTGCEIGVNVKPELCNSWGVAHGGLTMTLLDVVMAHAARSPSIDGTPHPQAVVTIEMKTSFMRPGLGRLLGTGRKLHGTASLAFCEAHIHDEQGSLVAQATGTFKYLQGGLPVNGRKIQRPHASD